MPLPKKQQIDNQKKDLTEHQIRLQKAYDEFLVSWNEIEKRERKLLSQLQNFKEKSQMHSILHNISNIKD